MPEDRLAAAVAELYGAAPEAFTERRGELAAAARDAGDRAAAKAITALRKPTRAAWVVNRLARADPSAPPKLAELAGALRAAQEARNGPRLRELSAARGALVDALTAQALATADLPDPAPPPLRLEVSQTLTAALADPEVAAAFATGTLTRAAQWSGFGVLPVPEQPGSADDAEPGHAAASGAAGLSRVRGAGEDSGARERGGGKPVPAEAATRAGQPSPGTARPARARPWAGTGPAVPVPGTAHPGTARPGTARRQAEEQELLAREAAQLAARRREQYEAAERLVAAATAAAEATATEDRLEAEVRDLEQRLTRARAELGAARMRARHAEAAERRARQAMDRLPREQGPP